MRYEVKSKGVIESTAFYESHPDAWNAAWKLIDRVTESVRAEGKTPQTKYSKIHMTVSNGEKQRLKVWISTVK